MNVRNQGPEINQVNMSPSRETNKAPITDPREIDIHELSEFILSS